MARSGSKWASRGEPHRHILPPRTEYSNPSNDRKCVPHVAGRQILCDVEGCNHGFGNLCAKCKKVV
jgi:hypothetical protein